MNVSIFKWLSFWCIVTADQQIGGSLDGSRVDIIPVVVSVCWFGLSVVNWDCCQTLGIYILVKTVGVDKKDVGNYGMGSRYRTFKWLHWYVYYMSVIFILCWLLLWLALLYCSILFSWRLTGLRLKVTITVAACLSCYCIAENYSRWLMFVCLLATCKQFIPLFFFLTAVVLLFQGAVCIIFMQWNELPSSLSLYVTELIQQQQQRPFNGLWSGTTRVGRYQKKTFTHSHPSGSSCCFLYHLSPFATVHGILFIQNKNNIKFINSRMQIIACITTNIL